MQTYMEGRETRRKKNVRVSAQTLEMSLYKYLLGVGAVLRLERDAVVNGQLTKANNK